jgi:dethiobiotin synthetase
MASLFTNNQKKVKKILITSSGTDQGKTLITCALAHQLTRGNNKIRVIKPIISGYNILSSDTAEILKSQNLPLNKKNIEQTSPWKFKAPLSPHIAANIEQKEINFEEVINFCNDAYSNSKMDYLIIEGAGGLMSPITNDKTMLDLVISLSLELILVVGSCYLGAITHLLTAIEVIKNYNIHLIKIIITDNQPNSASLNLQQFTDTIKNFTSVEILEVKYINKQPAYLYVPNLNI